MKVGIITFHASHNYGSMLQAYALQQTVLALGHDCRIINFRTAKQKKMYNPLFMKKKWVKSLDVLRHPLLTVKDIRKHSLFEKFMRDNFILTPREYGSVAELGKESFDFDCYISGSDQIWNSVCPDFSTAYYLDFVRNGKRIAYAPSMGPYPEQGEADFSRFVSGSLSRYDAISVREPGTAAYIRSLTDREVTVAADPTLLLSASRWSAVAGDSPIVRGKYVLLYTPWYEYYPELYAEAARFARQHGLKVICTLPDGYREWHGNPNFRFFISVGPAEFLNLIKHASYVLCGSFHAVVFSLLFQRPFYAFRGMDDSRVSHLLELTGMEECAAEIRDAESFDFSHVGERIRPFVETSQHFLSSALGGISPAGSLIY